MNRIPTSLLPWFEARKRFKLSHAQIQMARELGMNPRKLGKLANEKQELWKLPLPEFIAKCYRKRFGRSEPEQVRSLEEMIKADERRRRERKARKVEKKRLAGEPAPSGVLAEDPPPASHQETSQVTKIGGEMDIPF
jgi:hypothetical protein